MPVARHEDGIGVGLREVGDINMGDAGVLPLGGPDGPAHHLDAGKPLRGGEGEHLVEREFREDRGHKTESHRRPLFWFAAPRFLIWHWDRFTGAGHSEVVISAGMGV